MPVNTTTPPPAYEVADLCKTYRSQSPTARYLFQNAPPEYFPLLGVGAFFLLLNTALFIVETIKHSKYFRDVYFKLSSRVVVILSAYWLFASTNFLGIIFVRGDIFLHFVANVFESACLLAFFDCILLHCRALGETFDGSVSIPIKVPPCCCCLLCLPDMKTTKTNLKWLRFAIIQLMFLQTLVEFMRTLAVFDCSFDPEAPQVLVFDILVLVSFFIAMWAVFVVVKGKGSKLEKYRYMQKFALFKLMIIVQKLMYKILAFVAKRGYISSYRGLNGKLRCAIWTNFVCVIVSTLLFFIARSLFTVDDYQILKEAGTTEQYQVDENSQQEHIEASEREENDVRV